MLLFNEYLNKKEKEYKKELNILEGILKQSGLEIKSNLDKKGADGYYVYVYNPYEDLSFEGIRVYMIGDAVSYRAQRRFETEPFGDAYHIDVEEMFDENTEDGKEEQEVAEEVANEIVEEVKQFFQKSVEAEKELIVMNRSPKKEKETLGKTTGTNYSSKVFEKGT